MAQRPMNHERSLRQLREHLLLLKLPRLEKALDEQLARAAREHVTREFSWDRIAQQMEEAYLCAVRRALPRP